jgi:hypothetical protein
MNRSIVRTFRPALRRPLALAAAVVLPLLAAAPVAEACTCAPPGEPRAELEHADAVFSGRVVEVEPEEAQRGFRRLAVRFALDSVWKGVPEGDQVTVWTAEQSAACGYSFQPGEEYLVYAYDAGELTTNELTTNLCSRNAPLAQAAEDLAALGEPQRRVAAESTKP